jgi:hypothetical protein
MYCGSQQAARIARGHGVPTLGYLVDGVELHAIALVFAGEYLRRWHTAM